MNSKEKRGEPVANPENYWYLDLLSEPSLESFEETKEGFKNRAVGLE